MENIQTGTVKWFNDEKGFGSISSQSGEDFYVHHSDIQGDSFKTMNEGQQVSFVATKGQNHMLAKGVQVI
ncbi:cold-shock protein [Pseudomonas sp. URMO17WK12:I11]|uniref:cold-shock protein n=1 Tax=Pseudomonas sp. URMO17WK12:I11 TaxID=1283291 RepID=UPI0011A821DD|nr:cold shock domain-containing protein [Pseudomonas sp. URMO17WK12:I11]